MNWVSSFDLFLFDFDGLLVDTERLHYQAYQMALRVRGYEVDWSFARYCELAHVDGETLKRELLEMFPALSISWDRFYEEKKGCYASLLQEGHLRLMPGVADLLEYLQKQGIRRSVVTHSTRGQVDAIRAHLSPLQTIPHWVTRENYGLPKPHPECYRTAIALHGLPGDRIIGFEDSLRGFRALEQTEALPVLVCRNAPFPGFHQTRGVHFASFLDVQFS